MTIKEIPKSFLYICDNCGIEHKQENANGHYSDSRPPHWARIILRRDAYDYQGQAVADASIERLLCGDCGDLAIDALNSLRILNDTEKENE